MEVPAGDRLEACATLSLAAGLSGRRLAARWLIVALESMEPCC